MLAYRVVILKFPFQFELQLVLFGHLIGLNELGWMNDLLDFSSRVENDNLNFRMANWFSFTFYFA